MGKKQPKPLPKREYKVVKTMASGGIPIENCIQGQLSHMARDGWEFVQAYEGALIVRREL